MSDSSLGKADLHLQLQQIDSELLELRQRTDTLEGKREDLLGQLHPRSGDVSHARDRSSSSLRRSFYNSQDDEETGTLDDLKKDVEKLESSVARKQTFGENLQETIRKEKESMGPVELISPIKVDVSVTMTDDFLYPAGRPLIKGELRSDLTYSAQRVSDHVNQEDTVAKAAIPDEDDHLEENGINDPSLFQEFPPCIGDSHPTLRQTNVDANQSYRDTSHGHPQLTRWSHVQETLSSHQSGELSSKEQACEATDDHKVPERFRAEQPKESIP